MLQYEKEKLRQNANIQLIIEVLQYTTQTNYLTLESFLITTKWLISLRKN